MRLAAAPVARAILVLALAGITLSALIGPAGVAVPEAGAAPSPARPGAPQQGGFSLDKPLYMTADDVTVDSTGAGLIARGHVRVTYGADVATGDLLHLTNATRTAEFSGHVLITDPRGKASGDTVLLSVTPDNRISRAILRGNAGVEGKEYALSADQIDADRAAGRFLAQGHVNAFSAPDLIVVGDRITYDQRTQRAVVSGHPVVSNRLGRLTGDWMEFFRAENRAVVHGPAQAEVYGATITGAGATVDFTASVAVFTGDAVVTRRQGTVRGDRLTVYYAARRIRVDGTTHAHFADLGEDETSP